MFILLKLSIYSCRTPNTKKKWICPNTQPSLPRASTTWRHLSCTAALPVDSKDNRHAVGKSSRLGWDYTAPDCHRSTSDIGTRVYNLSDRSHRRYMHSSKPLRHHHRRWCHSPKSALVPDTSVYDRRFSLSNRGTLQPRRTNHTRRTNRLTSVQTTSTRLADFHAMRADDI